MWRSGSAFRLHSCKSSERARVQTPASPDFLAPNGIEVLTPLTEVILVVKFKVFCRSLLFFFFGLCMPVSVGFKKGSSNINNCPCKLFKEADRGGVPGAPKPSPNKELAAEVSRFPALLRQVWYPDSSLP